jgi:hypothetical protein
MGVDYSAVGGIGIRVNKYINKIIESGAFTQEEWNEDCEYCLDSISIKYRIYGNTLSSKCHYAWMVTGKNLEEVISSAAPFIASFANIGVHLNLTDLEVIEESLIW